VLTGPTISTKDNERVYLYPFQAFTACCRPKLTLYVYFKIKEPPSFSDQTQKSKTFFKDVTLDSKVGGRTEKYSNLGHER
jgi:hypothetical protein